MKRTKHSNPLNFILIVVAVILAGTLLWTLQSSDTSSTTNTNQASIPLSGNLNSTADLQNAAGYSPQQAAQVKPDQLNSVSL